MSHIYGSNRQNNNRNDGQSEKTARVSPEPKNKDKRKVVLTSVIVNAAIAAVMIVFSFILISSPESREIYTNFLFLPVSAFAGAFLSFLLNKNLLINASCSAAVFLLAHFIFVEFSLWAVLWTLFYMLNAFIGFLAGLVVRTFH